MKSIALLGEFNPTFKPHLVTVAAIEHSRAAPWVGTVFKVGTFIACPEFECDVVGAGSRLQGCRGDIRIGFSQISHALICNEIASMCQ